MSVVGCLHPLILVLRIDLFSSQLILGFQLFSFQVLSPILLVLGFLNIILPHEFSQSKPLLLIGVDKIVLLMQQALVLEPQLLVLWHVVHCFDLIMIFMALWLLL